MTNTMPKHDERRNALRMVGVALTLLVAVPQADAAATSQTAPPGPAAPAAAAPVATTADGAGGTGLDSAAQAVNAAARSVYDTGSWAFWAAADTAASVYAGVGQALYETAYMIGINATPLDRPDYVDPIALSKTGDTPTPPPATDKAAAAIPPSPAAIAATTPAAAPAGPADGDAGAADEPPPSPTLKPIAPGLLANLIYDRSSRNADGSYFVPKTLQRMFEVRTQRLTETEIRAGIKLNGRVIPDPQAHGQVQAGVTGRIDAPDTGLPVLGDSVRKGQILATITPVVGVVDRSQVRREVARLTHEIRQTAESIEMMKQFSFVPFREGKIIQMEIRLDGLRQERAALLPMLKTQEYLRAPIDGVIAASTAVAGRVAQPGEMVFDIVNPSLLWIEASVPDPQIASDTQPGITATARTPEGQTLNVTYVGSGPAVRQQSTPMLFRIDSPPKGLRVGRPAAILLREERQTQRGLPVPRAAISVGADGVQQVWEQTDAETFVSHPVQTQDIDAQTVLIVNGVRDGARIVVRGVSLMAQVQ